MEENEVYSILPEVQAIYNEIVEENPNLTKVEIDAKVEEIYNARKEKASNEEVKEEEAEEKPEVTDEVKELQSTVSSIETRLADMEAGQEKIVSVMESLVEKQDSKTEVSDDEQKNDVTEEVVSNDASSEEESKEAEEVSEEETEEKVENDNIEEVIENPVESEEEAQDINEVANSSDEDIDSDELTDDEDDEDDDDKKAKAKNDIEEASTEEQSAEEETETKTNNQEETMTEDQIKDLVARIKNELADEAVKAPEVEEVEAKKEENSFNTKNYLVRYNEQVAAAWDAYRLKSAEGAEKLRKINEFNYQEMVKAGRVSNDTTSGPITIDGDPGIGGFVLPPEIDTMIHGKRTDYSDLLSQITYAQTSSLQFAYATRVGDINMRPVKMCESGGTITDDANHVRPDNLKAIEGYSLKQGLAQLEEFAAVTPICTSVTRFAAADILQDVAAGYRTDYDRKLAQLFVIRLQQAVDLTDNVVEFDPASATDALVDFVKATTKVSDGVVNGKFLFNARTKAALLEYIFKSGNGGDLTTNAFTNGDVPTIFGFPYIVVPNDLLPTLGEGDIKTFVAQSLDGTTIETVDITSPVFYGDFTEYRGKVHGGLYYDVSAEAPYEVYDASGVKEVRSAWQRNELVLRGSFYRGGYFADPTVIAGLTPVSS